MQYDGTKSVARSRQFTTNKWKNENQPRSSQPPLPQLFLKDQQRGDHRQGRRGDQSTNMIAIAHLGIAMALHCLDTVIIAILLQVGEQVRREAMRQVEKTNWLSRQVRG